MQFNKTKKKPQQEKHKSYSGSVASLYTWLENRVNLF